MRNKVYGIRYCSKRKYVNFLSDIYLTCQQKKADTKHRWKVLEFYNNHRDHVNLADMFMSKYRWRHRNYKWTKVAFLGILDIIVYNSWIIYKNAIRENISYRDFRVKLVQEITQEYGEKRRSNFSNQHQLCLELPKKRHRCYYHSGECRTSYRCIKCSKYMCIKCFKKKHNL